MIYFVHPEAFLLAALVLVLLRKHLGSRRLVVVLRVVLVIVATGLLAEPYLARAEQGRDLILVVDRSRSMPSGAVERLEEAARLAAEEQGDTDRIGVVVFGRVAVVESSQVETFRYRPPQKKVDPDGSDVAAALDTAMALIPEGRFGTILLISDGEQTGRDTAQAVRVAMRRGIRIDTITARRPAALDVAVEDVALPAQIHSGEPFQFSAWVRADRPVEAEVRLSRNGVVIVHGKRQLSNGLNRLLFHDRLVQAGVREYQVEVAVPGDRVPENNRARSLVRVVGPWRVLCVTPTGRQDRLTRSLQAAGLRVVIRAPQAANLGLSVLDGFRAVVLENVPATDLPAGSLQSLASYVRDLGGGLLLTGGQASFGPGGYYRSAVERVLPVTMEIREEHRKNALAMVVALDRSGSMAMRVPGGKTKMDLANLGTCAAIELLTRRDAVAVIAVDSAPHIVVPMGNLTDKPKVLDKVRSIESMGGGIFVFEALKAAAQELLEASQRARHIVLFADAADAEQPGDYRTLVPKLARAGITVSVIGLGQESDSDANFLKDVAKLGNGRVFFVADPKELPRVFAQETIQVAKSSVVTEPTKVKVIPDIIGVGQLALTSFPELGGHSIAYLRSGGQLGLLSEAEKDPVPILSFWQHGLGRSAAFLGEVDGELSGTMANWAGFTDFFATVVRWLAGNEARQDIFCTFERRGQDALLSVEVPAGKEALLSTVRARLVTAEGTAKDVVLERTGNQKLEVRIPLSTAGNYRVALQTGDGQFLRVPPITLPYSPEFEPRLSADEGEKHLRRLSRLTGGTVDGAPKDWFAGERSKTGITDLTWFCAWLAVLLLLLEIAVRRLHLGTSRRRQASPS